MIGLPFFSGYVVAVLGLGTSGLAAARALQASGAEVWAWDDSEDKRAAAAAKDVPLVDLYSCNWLEPVSLVLSPGIPHTHPAPHPVAALAREHGVEIIGDIELLGRAQPDARYIGITGTNGKSTTTAIVGHVMQLAGRRATAGGNLGQPVMSFEALGNDGIYVLELSSYQLELTFTVTFDVAVLLNISPDHLDRHGGMPGYVAAKRNIFRRQTAPRTAVIGIDDPISRGIYEELRSAGDQIVWPISAKGPIEGGVYAIDGQLYDDTDRQSLPVLNLAEAENLQGQHNWQNAAAAYAACKAAQVPPPVIAACLHSFPGLAHRQERVAEIDGVLFINDSKATNADAAARALSCYDRIYWILGGRAKEGGLNGLEGYFPKVAKAFLIGEAEVEFAAFLDGKLDYQRCGDLDSAVAAASAAAREGAREEAAKGQPGSVVLLSPACASFDQFANFEARGDRFRAAVKALAVRGALT